MKKVLYVAACLISGTALMMATPVARAAGIDAEAAKTMIEDNECTKCHSVDKTKKGPSYKKIAAKYKGKPEAEAKLVKHMLSGDKVKLEDGSKEDHKIIEPKDDAKVKNVAQWILSL
jgi:cytochrome c